MPVGLGWLRASHRKLDPDRSLPYRPWHTHDEEWPLKPGEPVELDIEIWPTSIVVPPGYQLALNIRGSDYEVDGTDIALPNAPYPMKGVGPFLHIDSDDRPAAVFATRNIAAFRPRAAALPVVADHPGRIEVGHHQNAKLPVTYGPWVVKLLCRCCAVARKTPTGGSMRLVGTWVSEYWLTALK